MIRILLCLSMMVFLTSTAHSKKPLGNPSAVKGGSFTLGLPDYPKSFLVYLAYEELASIVSSFVLDTLLDNDLQTYEVIPRIAKSWTVSKDKRIFTLKLDPTAKFSDGTALTSADVKFTWDAVMNPKHKTVPFQSYFSSFESCEAPSPDTVIFKARTIHFKNLIKLASIAVLPKHIYEGQDFNRAFLTKLVGSGPYELISAETGKKIVFKRNPNYWGQHLYQNVGRYNFDDIVVRSIPDPNVQFEIFKKGETDYFYFTIAKMWETETNGPLFENKYVLKMKGETKATSGLMGIVWNLRKPMFQDKKVRWALSYLLKREKMIKELFYNNYSATAGVIAVNSPFHSEKLKPTPYDPKKAKDLLNEAGWTQTDKDGVLVKNGQRFEFELLADNPTLQRFVTIYQEDLKQMGIRLNVRITDWASFLKLKDDHQFDSVLMMRGRDPDPSDFSEMWGSENADRKGSTNDSGYKNEEVDKLAAEIDQTFDRKKRIPLVKKLDEIVTADQPLTYLWEPKYFRIGYSNKVSYSGRGYFDYSGWSDVFHHWWYDETKAKKLADGRSQNKPVP